MTGPKLTQRKIDKLRDALNVVRECDQVPMVFKGLLDRVLWTLPDLERDLPRKP